MENFTEFDFTEEGIFQWQDLDPGPYHLCCIKVELKVLWYREDEFVKLFIQDAIAKFVEPLTNIYSSDEKVETESEAEINHQSQPNKKVYDYISCQ